MHRLSSGASSALSLALMGLRAMCPTVSLIYVLAMSFSLLTQMINLSKRWPEYSSPCNDDLLGSLMQGIMNTIPQTHQIQSSSQRTDVDTRYSYPYVL